MADYATNGIGSNEAFEKRKNYLQDYPTGPNLPNPINFRKVQYKNYGRLNNRNDFVHPAKRNLKEIGDYKVQALNFVADAYNDFERYMKITKKQKLIPDSFISSNWAARKGFFDVEQEYVNSMNAYYSSFVSEYLSFQDKHKDIHNFEDFLEIFINQYLNTLIDTTPVTLTGLISSRYVGPNMSGLCIEISNSDHGDDIEKVSNFISSPNFEFYILAANKFGFLVDMHAPWRLVANLNSPVMQEYAKNYIKVPILSGDTAEPHVVTENPITNKKGIHYHSYVIDENGNGYTTQIHMEQGGLEQPIAAHQHEIYNFVIQSQSLSVGVDLNSPSTRTKIPTHNHELPFIYYDNITTNDVFSSYYIPSYMTDIQSLAVYLVGIYNSYVATYPTVAVPDYCKDRSSSKYFQALKVKTQTREQITGDQVAEKYGDLFWLKTYFLIRLVELGVDLDKAKKVSNLRQLQEAYFSLDFQGAMNYIQLYLKQFY